MAVGLLPVRNKGRIDYALEFLGDREAVSAPTHKRITGREELP